MKLNKLWLVIVMFAVLAVPAFAVTLDDARQYIGYNSSLADASGNGLDGTAQGNAQVTGSVYKLGNGSLDCGNTNSDYVTLPTSTISGDSVGSFSLWMRPDVAGNNQMFLSAATVGSTTNRMRFMYDTTNKIQVNFNDGAWDSFQSDDTISPLAWHHIVVTHDGTNSRMYINGSLQSATGGNTWFDDITINTYRHCIRGYSATNGMQGWLDDVAYYERALNQSEVNALYNAGTGFNPYAAAVPTSSQFNITAFDAETAEQILTFNTTLNGTVLSTTNGTISYNITGFYNTVVNATGYQTVTTSKTYVAGTTTQWNLTAINRTATFKAFNNWSAPINTFNITTGTGATYTTTNGTIYASLDRTVLHNLSFNAVNYYSNVLNNFNASNDFNATLITVLKNVTFTATNYSGSPISDFNLTVDGTTGPVTTSLTIELDTRNLYNVTFDKTNFFDDVQTNVNISSDVVGNLTEHFRIIVGTTTSGSIGEFTDAVAYYTFDDNSGNTLIDGQGRANGTCVGTTNCDLTAGYLGTAIDLDGTSEYVDINSILSFVSNDEKGSVCAWTNAGDLNNRAVWGFAESGNATSRTKLFIDGASNAYRFNLNNGSWVTDIETSDIADINNWNHLCVVNNGTTSEIYVNGTQSPLNVTSNSDAWLADLTNLDTARIGVRAFNFNLFFAGKIDEFGYWNRSFTSVQVNELYNNYVNGFNIYNSSGGGASTNATDQYTVSWNSSTYYPNNENKTFLPVRFTLENFTVNPLSTAFKQAVFTNYDTTNHLTFTFNNSHEVIAINRYDSTLISNFTVNVSGNLYTANGTKAYLQNETGINNYSVTHPSYFTVYNENIDLTNGSSNVTMHQAELRFNGTQRFTNNTVAEGNVTIGSTKKAFGETFYLNAGNYTAVYSSVYDEANPQNFTVGALQNLSETIVNITNANLSITGINAVDGTPIPFFTTTVVNNTLFINLNKTEPSPHLYNLIQNVSYNVTFDNTTYALNDTLLMLDNRSTSYTFYVYTTNSFNISILDEQNATEITDTNFTVEFIGNYQSYNYTYTNGNLYADLIVPDLYQIRYEYINASGAKDYGLHRQYFHQLTNRTHNPLDMYALLNDESTRITVNIQNSDTLQREEGVFVLLQRFYLSNNSYETVAMYETDSQGNAYFDVELQNELYRFVLQEPFGTTLRTTTPSYLEETDYIIYTGEEQTVFANPINLGEMNVTFDWDNTTETLTVNYNDPAGVYGTYTLNLYEEGVYTNTLVNTSSASSSSGALVVSYAFKNDSEYIGTLTVSNSPAIVAASFRISDFTASMPLANLSLFLVSILFVIMTFISAFSLYSVVLGAVSLIAASMMGLLTFSGPVVGMIVFGSIMLAIVLEWRRG